MKRVRRSDPGPFSPLGCACRRHVRLIAHVDVRALDAPERGGCPPQRAPHTQLSTHARGRARHGPVWPRRPPRPSRRSHSRSVSVSVSVSVTPPLNLSTKRRPGGVHARVVTGKTSGSDRMGRVPQICARTWRHCQQGTVGLPRTSSRGLGGTHNVMRFRVSPADTHVAPSRGPRRPYYEGAPGTRRGSTTCTQSPFGERGRGTMYPWPVNGDWWVSVPATYHGAPRHQTCAVPCGGGPTRSG